jgi:hypothetical protein
MRRSLPLLLLALLAFMAPPAMANQNQAVVRGFVPHHHHFLFRNHTHFFSVATTPFFTPTFTLASPFIAQPLPFGSWPGGSGFGAFGGGFGGPVAFGEGGFPDVGAGAEPRVIVVAAPFGAPPARRAEEERATVEQTPSGVTIIRGPGSRH